MSPACLPATFMASNSEQNVTQSPYLIILECRANEAPDLNNDLHACVRERLGLLFHFLLKKFPRQPILLFSDYFIAV
jgi:hypothetical protein